MNGLNQISPTEIFEQRDFNGVVFSDVETFVKLAAEYLKRPRLLFKGDKKIEVGLVRNSDYAFENFRKLKYQGLWWNNGDIEAWKKPGRPDKNGQCLTEVIARGIEAVTALIEEDGY